MGSPVIMFALSVYLILGTPGGKSLTAVLSAAILHKIIPLDTWWIVFMLIAVIPMLLFHVVMVPLASVGLFIDRKKFDPGELLAMQLNTTIPSSVLMVMACVFVWWYWS